jgi:predicted lipase
MTQSPVDSRIINQKDQRVYEVSKSSNQNRLRGRQTYVMRILSTVDKVNNKKKGLIYS